MAKQESSVESFTAGRVILITRLALSAILFTNGDEKFGQKKVELIGRFVFSCSRLFQ